MKLKSALESMVSRRSLLLGALSFTVASVVAACTGGAKPAATSSPSTSVATTTASPTPVVVAPPACVVTPAETEGPYFVDERLNRSDITTDPAGGSVRPGAPLSLTFTVARVDSSGCVALPGAQVDVWHCDALGVYSDESAQGSTGKRYLRGYQVTDNAGTVSFQTIYPGWYPGRAVHIHFKVRTFTGTSKTFEFTSQVFFDDAVTDAVYAMAPYSSHPNRDTHNAADMVYASNNNSGAMLMASVAQAGSGYAATFGIGLKLA